MAVISKVDPGSPAALAGVRVGDRLVGLNGESLRDVIDYQLVCEADRLVFDLARGDRRLAVEINNRERRPLGLAFEKSVFDRLKICQNKCAFCFIDQLPPQCRSTLYVKDDDYRLSFLYGNFVTLTNLSPADISRIKSQRLSPLYASIHSVDSRIRRRLINPPKADRALENLKALLDAGIEVHIQIVACPGMNDGLELDNTLAALLTEYHRSASVGVVPVGLTGHRRNLPDIRSFTVGEAIVLIDQIERWQRRALEVKGYRWVYAADEFYLTSGIAMPPGEAYDDFPQIENGIGLTRTFLDEVDDWLNQRCHSEQSEESPVSRARDSSATPQNDGSHDRSRQGKYHVMTSPMGARVLAAVAPKFAFSTGISLEIIEAKNEWLGGQVSVTGLLAGSDIIRAIDLFKPAGPVYVPDICLNRDGLFLDNLTVEQIEEVSRVEIVPVPAGGYDLMEALANA